MTNNQGSATKEPCPTTYIMNEFKVEAGNWYTNVKLPNNSDEPLELQASEAGTIAVAKFFTGSVHIKDINKPLGFLPVMTVTFIHETKLKSREVKYSFYSPKMIANAGWHEEASLLHKKFYENKKPFPTGKFKTLKEFLEWKFSDENQKTEKRNRQYKLLKRKKDN